MASPYSRDAFRTSAWQFLTGKAASALLTLTILLWVVRVLPVEQYGVYVAFAATMELCLSLAPLGLPWLAARYLPEFRLHATVSRTTRFLRRLVLRYLLLLGGFICGIYWIGLEALLPLLRLDGYESEASLYLIVIMAEGAGRFFRENLLGPLMRQGTVRMSLVLRQVAFISGLTFTLVAGSFSLKTIVQVELVAALAGTMVAMLGLVIHLRKIEEASETSQWREPTEGEMWRTANNMYAARLLSLVSSPQVLVLVVQRYLGSEAGAVFGFLRNIYEQLGRYLPANLLFSVVQPKLVAAYVGGGGARELERNANLAGKLSLFALMPFVSLAAVGGESLITLASGAKFPNTGMMFLGFMLALVPFSQRLLFETVAMAAGYSNLCTRASISGLFILPLVLALIYTGMGMWSAILGLGLGYLLFNIIVLRGLKRRSGYSADTRAFVKLIVAALAAYLAGVCVPEFGRLETLIAQTLVVGAAYLFVAWVVKPFDKSERSRLNGLINRRVFIW